MNSKDVKQNPVQGKPQAKVKGKLGPILKKLYKYRSIAMAIPVAAGSAILATFSMAKLPATVTLNLPGWEEGELVLKLLEMDKSTAVIVPVIITAVCLLMMFCSRRQTYPWLVSLFSLALPIILLFAGMFPG